MPSGIVDAAAHASFQSLTIAHPRLVAADAELRRLLRQPAGPGLVLVFGPTGVGKTTLLRRVEQVLCAADGSSEIGARRVIASAPEGVAFDWRDFYRRALRELAEPEVEAKRAIPEYRDGAAEPATRLRATLADLRHSLEVTLRRRQTRALLIDEAPHLASSGSARRLLQQLDVVKSLADASGATIVLAGTYELLRFRHLNAQLSRRCQEVHLGRYRASIPEDLEAWRGVVATFEAGLPVPVARSLLEAWEELYERSLGCVGILKSWLLHAVQVAASEGRPLAKRHLSATALPIAAVRTMTHAALEAESQVADDPHEAARLRTLLGMTSRGSGLDRRRPGDRRPGRDPVGAGS